jgi:hypothetical protein
MLKVELAPLVILLMLMTTPSVADVTSELARCQLEVERLYPAPPDKGDQNWADRAANLQKRARGSAQTAAHLHGKTQPGSPRDNQSDHSIRVNIPKRVFIISPITLPVVGFHTVSATAA